LFFDKASKIVAKKGRMSDDNGNFEMFENVLSNLLTKQVFYIEKLMNAVRFSNVETTEKILSHNQCNYSKCVSISESHRDLIQCVENL